MFQHPNMFKMCVLLNDTTDNVIIRGSLQKYVKQQFYLLFDDVNKLAKQP